MVQILEENPTFGQRLAKAFGTTANQAPSQVINSLLGQRQAQAENETLKRLTGQDISGLTPEQKQIFLKNQFKNTGQNQQIQTALQGLDTIKRQRELLDTGHLGSKFAFAGTGRDIGCTFSGQGKAARAEYERLGKSLIALASTIPIRNQREFDYLSEGLADPTLTQEEIKANLDAMERIIRGSLGGASSESQSQQQSNDQTVQMKDASGDVYDIPANLVEQARAKGLK